MSKPTPRVEIEWIDSGAMVANDTWTPTSHVMHHATNGNVVTVGHLLQLNPDVAVVGLSYDAGFDNWFGCQIIERKSIQKITVLRARKEYGPAEFDSVPDGMVMFDTRPPDVV